MMTIAPPFRLSMPADASAPYSAIGLVAPGQTMRYAPRPNVGTE